MPVTLLFGRKERSMTQDPLKLTEICPHCGFSLLVHFEGAHVCFPNKSLRESFGKEKPGYTLTLSACIKKFGVKNKQIRTPEELEKLYSS